MTIENITDEGEGPAILMVHGWGHTKLVLEPLANNLKQKFRVITFDLPGHGTARNEPGPYSYERYCDTIRRVVENLRIEKFHMLGWSMGGQIVSLYCLNKAGPLPESLILISATPRFVAKDKNPLVGQHPVKVTKMKRMINSDPENGVRDFINGIFETGEKISPQLREEMERFLFAKDFPPKKEALLETLGELEKTDLTLKSGAYDKRVLLIYGRLDKINPPMGQIMWKGLFERIEEVSFNYAGHVPHITKCPEVTRSIAGFISKQG